MSSKRYKATLLGIESSFLAIVGMCMVMVTTSVVADEFPTKPIRIVVPYPPGGSPDLVARALATAAAEKLGQSVVVENRPGANGMLATELVARSSADGYTLLMGSDGPIVITPLLRGESPSSPKLRLAPVTLVADSSFVLLASRSVPAETLSSLVAYGRENQEKLNFGSSGVGSQHHLAGLMLATVAQLKMTHVPYKGFGEAVADVIAGRVELLFGSVPAGAPHVAAGKLKGIAITGPVRSPLLPGVATAAEQGFPDLSINAWFGVMAPADTPALIVKTLDNAFRSALTGESLKAFLTSRGLNVLGSDSREFEARLEQDRLRWAKVIKAAGVKLD